MTLLVTAGCAATLQRLPAPTELPIVGEPSPGSFHLTSDPPHAPHLLTIRIDQAGGPSGRSAEFEAGQRIVVHWSDLPLPATKWIEVSGQDCEGTFGIQARAETDLLLILENGTCRVEVLGMHPEGASHQALDD